MISSIPEARITGDQSVEITHMEYDSRLVKPGSLFFAIKGYAQDGFDFVEDAVKAGAVAVVGERESCDEVETYVRVPDTRVAMAEIAARFYEFPGKKLRLCGVTGTNGKTTTCHLIKNILETRGKKIGLVTSSIYDTGGETFPAERTTPESLDMQRLMVLMKKNDCSNAVVEVSSHALELHRVDQLAFRVVLFTNLTRDHLDFHGTMENYLAAKSKLLTKLNGALSYVVINLDVPEFRPLFGDFSCSYLSYSLKDTNADVYCTEYEIKPDATIMELVTPMGHRTVKLSLSGRFNLMNGIAAAAAGLAAGVDLDSLVVGLEKSRPIPGRFNYVGGGQPFAVYVDYAHTPDAITRLCESARELCSGKLLLLFGCGGDRDRGKRPLMGTAATEAADYVVVTSDNPRSEEAEAIIDDIRPGLKGDQHEVIMDRQEAIEQILKKANDGDVVLIAGKGAENYQEIKGVRHPFDDTAEIRRVLSDLGYAKMGEEN
ncbi:MAG: UDP-N-acetylmuramoyl-L-alanyl-D-glutamate--2,6-diaminopimelate ligase [bacterium]|nr:UDP-N-acetylmuramoyl-L-alanyl-D-glutamate--2,6-diaminopimelate ligase [bacterium]